MFQAVVFDFNGVLANDEPVHLEAFRSVAFQEGLNLTDDVYYERYLAFNDWDLFRALYRDNDRNLLDNELETLVTRKSESYHRSLEGRQVLFDGAERAVKAAAENCPLGIASGARRDEIDRILQAGSLGNYFSVIVAAEDVEEGKPGPEPFLKATDQLASRHGRLDRGRCLAVEDSFGGIRSAKAAGLGCLAVEHSYDQSHLVEADWILKSIREFDQWIRERVA